MPHSHTNKYKIMTLEDIIEIFGILHGLSNQPKAIAAEYGFICQNYLTYLRICFADVTPQQKQEWLISTKSLLISNLQKLKIDGKFNSYHSVIDSMLIDIENNGAVLQELADVRELITQLTSIMNINNDVLYEEGNADDLPEIFIQLEAVGSEFQKQAWASAVTIYRRLRLKLQSYDADSLTLNQHLELAQYQKIYILAMLKLAGTHTTLEKTVAAYHNVFLETQTLLEADNKLIENCLITALTHITQIEPSIPTTISSATVNLLTDIIQRAQQLIKLQPSTALLNGILGIQEKLINTLLEMASTNKESLVKNLLLAYKLIENYMQVSGNQTKMPLVFQIQLKLYESLKQFAEECNANSQFELAATYYQQALPIFLKAAPHSNRPSDYAINTLHKMVIARTKAGLQQATENGVLLQAGQSKINQAISENNTLLSSTLLKVQHQSLFARLLFEYANKIFNETQLPVLSLTYFKAAAREINKITVFHCNDTMNLQINTYNEWSLKAATMVCERFTELDLCFRVNLELLIETHKTLSTKKSAKDLGPIFAKALEINRAAFKEFGKHLQELFPQNSIFSLNQSSEHHNLVILLQQNIYHLNYNSLFSFKALVQSYNQTAPDSSFKSLLNSACACIENLIILGPLAPQTPQLRITA
jgi:hypothetical protein